MDNTNTTTTTTAKPFVIRLRASFRRKPYYLKSYRAARPRTIETLGKDCRARITTTDFADNARGFATLDEALAFRAEFAPMFFGYEWEVVAR